MPKTGNKIINLQPRLRVISGDEIAFGPGKADLLEHIQNSGSISLAARDMGISYMRAWKLIQIMNGCFKAPLVASSRGGKERGGAQLTPAGEEVLQIYRQMEADSSLATKSSWAELKKLLRR